MSKLPQYKFMAGFDAYWEKYWCILWRQDNQYKKNIDKSLIFYVDNTISTRKILREPQYKFMDGFGAFS